MAPLSVVFLLAVMVGNGISQSFLVILLLAFIAGEVYGFVTPRIKLKPFVLRTIQVSEESVAILLTAGVLSILVVNKFNDITASTSALSSKTERKIDDLSSITERKIDDLSSNTERKIDDLSSKTEKLSENTEDMSKKLDLTAEKINQLDSFIKYSSAIASGIFSILKIVEFLNGKK